MADEWQEPPLGFLFYMTGHLVSVVQRSPVAMSDRALCAGHMYNQKVSNRMQHEEIPHVEGFCSISANVSSVQTDSVLIVLLDSVLLLLVSFLGQLVIPAGFSLI